MSEYFPSFRQCLRLVGRSLVFLIGGVAAFVNALIADSYSRSPLVLFYAEVIASLALMFAAPVFFCLATFGSAGDRWTIRYSIAWMVFIVAYCVVGLIARVT